MLLDETKKLSSNSQEKNYPNFYQPIIKQEPANDELEDLADIDFKGIENLVAQVGQPITPEVLNFDDSPPPPANINVNQFLLPYQYLQSFNDFHNYPGIFLNPNWMP